MRYSKSSRTPRRERPPKDGQFLFNAYIGSSYGRNKVGNVFNRKSSNDQGTWTPFAQQVDELGANNG